MTDNARFVLSLPPVKPGDFGPDGLAVFGDSKNNYRMVIVGNGDVVEALSDPEPCEKGAESFRRVRVISTPGGEGFTGRVLWGSYWQEVSS